MADERERELERRYKESKDTSAGWAWAAAVMRNSGDLHMSMIKLVIRQHRALTLIGNTSQPGTERRAFGDLLNILDSEVTPEDVVSYVQGSDNWKKVRLPRVEVVVETTYTAVHCQLHDEPAPTCPCTIRAPTLNMLRAHLLDLHQTMPGPITFIPSANLRSAYLDGRTITGFSGDDRRAIGQWMQARYGTPDPCCHISCSLPAINERLDDRVRCAYHYDSLVSFS